MDFFYAQECVADVAEAYIFVTSAVSVDLDATVEEELVEVDVDAVPEAAGVSADFYWNISFAKA